MKKIFAFISIIIISSNFLFAQIELDSDGNVKLWGNASGTQSFVTVRRADNNDPNLSYALLRPAWSHGMDIGTPTIKIRDIYTYYIKSTYTDFSSDERMKEDIRLLKGEALDKIMKLDGVKYNFKEDILENFKGKAKEKAIEMGKNRCGFIAQDMIDVCPDLVRLDDETGMYSIDYIGVIPLLVESIKEQQEIIGDLNAEIEKIKKETSGSKSNKNLKSAENQLVTSTETEATTAKLMQNAPNPFSESTSISYFIPDVSISAMICIYDMQGTQLRCYDIYEKGNGKLSINGNELNAGMFLYTLIVDGKEVDTKRMILTNK